MAKILIIDNEIDFCKMIKEQVECTTSFKVEVCFEAPPCRRESKDGKARPHIAGYHDAGGDRPGNSGPAQKLPGNEKDPNYFPNGRA